MILDTVISGWTAALGTLVTLCGAMYTTMGLMRRTEDRCRAEIAKYQEKTDKRFEHVERVMVTSSEFNLHRGEIHKAMEGLSKSLDRISDKQDLLNNQKNETLMVLGAVKSQVDMLVNHAPARIQTI